MSKRTGSPGIRVIRGRLQPPHVPATVIVVSGPATGPSIVATVLQRLDVQMIDDVLALVPEPGRDEQLRTLAQHNDMAHRVWGFEMREGFRLLPSLLHLFRNPRVVVAFRDLVTVAEGGESAIPSGFAERLMTAALENLALAEMVRALPAPTLLVSYEKALVAPHELVCSLAAHCGIEPRRGQRLGAIRAVENGRASHRAARPLWYEGRLEGVDGDKVARGWARRMPGSEPCMIEIVSDGVAIGRGLSNQRRANGDPETLQRGFTIHLAAPPTGTLTARVAGTSTELVKHSPVTQPRRDGLAAYARARFGKLPRIWASVAYSGHRDRGTAC